MKARASNWLVVAFAVSTVHAQTYFVDDSATGANNGSSWTDAFTDLQSALALASAGTEVWVAEGLYHPAAPGNPGAAFVVGADVRVYGGFAGAETSLAQRDIALHPTVLSGDLLGDDGPGFTNRADNSHGVVVFSNGGTSTTLDGLVIADGESPGHGGGVRDVVGYGARAIRNCTLRRNRAAAFGAGMWLMGNAAVEDTLFLDNSAGFDGGGLDLESSGLVVRCVFLGNVTAYTGGGVWCLGGTFRECVFSGNRAGSAAGALYGDKGTVSLSDCTISQNHAGSTGGVGALSLTTSNSILWGNSANTGTLYQQQISGGIVNGCTVQGAAGIDGLDPRFASASGADGIDGTIDDDVRLLPGSPCIDAGSNALVPAGTTLDAARLPRFADDPDTPDTGLGTAPIVDRGAHEYQPCAAPVSFCITSPNSVGPGALMGYAGTAHLYAHDLVLTASGCPPTAIGVFFVGTTAIQVPFGNGVRCVGGSVTRLPIVHANASGMAAFAFDASVPAVPIVPGSDRRFQLWYRNPIAGGAGFNLSDGLRVVFCP